MVRVSRALGVANGLRSHALRRVRAVRSIIGAFPGLATRPERAFRAREGVGDPCLLCESARGKLGRAHIEVDRRQRRDRSRDCRQARKYRAHVQPLRHVDDHADHLTLAWRESWEEVQLPLRADPASVRRRREPNPASGPRPAWRASGPRARESLAAPRRTGRPRRDERMRAPGRQSARRGSALGCASP
jgi:hypothetical protein